MSYNVEKYENLQSRLDLIVTMKMGLLQWPKAVAAPPGLLLTAILRLERSSSGSLGHNCHKCQGGETANMYLNITQADRDLGNG